MTNRDIAGGSPEPLGVTISGAGVNVAVYSANASAIEFCLFDDVGQREIRRIQLPERTGDIFHGYVARIGEGARYGFRAHGPFAPGEGFRFNPSKLLVDPYALTIDRPFRLHASMFGNRPDGRGRDDQDSAAAMPKAVICHPEAARLGAELTPWPQTILYELHVRGFSMRREAIPAELRGAFSGLGHPASIEHLTRLGVTTIEIMPAAAWIEERHLAVRGLQNYWGYNPVAFMAPDPRLAPGGWAEIRGAVESLAAAGIETIVDVVFNHTGEGDALGPTLSLRGFDNSSYYRLVADDPAAYVDDAGCGNILALDRPPVIRLVMDSLRTWAMLAGVHGFRLDLATTLGRRPDGFDRSAPLLAAIAQDPILRTLKLIAEPWDVGPGGYQLGAFPAGWGEWNDRFRDDIRRFWRGDAAQLGPLATRLAGSVDAFREKRRPSRGINFITAHDGFTLADLVSYEHRHNQANGEGNRDGTEANLSWNNGVEGPSDDPLIIAARIADQRALLATLLLARGTPMISMGAELGQSQGGNNNAYAQDNDTTWIDWGAANAGLIDWTTQLIGVRRDHPAVWEDRFFAGSVDGDFPEPDVAWLRPDGRPMMPADWEQPDGAVLMVAFAASRSMGSGRLGFVLNRSAAPAEIALPEAGKGRAWRLLADSAAPDNDARLVETREFRVGPRSVTIFDDVPAARPPSDPRRGSAEALQRLAAASGIAAEWWDVNGGRHLVGDDTKRALLAAMGLPAAQESEAWETLERLAEDRARRPLPYAVTGWADEAAALRIPLPMGLERRPVRLSLSLPDGGMRSVLLEADSGDIALAVAPDGREHQIWRAVLPSLPVGRYRLQREDEPDFLCALTIAPRRCYFPPALAEGRKRFGIAAQLYSLCRPGDQGIGDFTTLAELAERAAAAGAATVAINPLHALFPNQRERASPYQPSDRRFLDPIYLDIEGAQRDAGASLSQLGQVNYAGVWDLKRGLLEERFKEINKAGRSHPDSEAAESLAAFVMEGGRSLRRFATFQAIAEAYPRIQWPSWPNGLSDADGIAVEAFAQARPDRVRFYQFLQYLCAHQFGAAAARAGSAGLDLGLLRDLAVGAAPDGAEVWAQPGLFAGSVSIGAPPDTLAPQGQVWGLPAPNPLSMAENGFAAFAELLAANMRYAGGLRIDHVMALTRLFWVPDGAEGADGAYVAYPFEDLLAQVTFESMKARCLIVGEDLGTVPDGLRAALSAADILSYRVLLLEREGLGFKPSASYPAKAVACVTTHDLPPFAGWWEAKDIAERKALHLIDDAAASRLASERETEHSTLLAAIATQDMAVSSDADSPPSGVAAAAHAYVGASPAALVLAQADDLADESFGVNLPGTNTERPNWRRRLGAPLADLFDSPHAQAILGAVRAGRS